MALGISEPEEENVQSRHEARDVIYSLRAKLRRRIYGKKRAQML
jgi:hypothetical protein